MPKRLVRGFGANAYGQAVTAIVQILGVPILLHSWGKELYGEWLILFAIPSYLSMTDLGFSQSAANDMTARAGRDDREGALKVFQSLAIMVYILVGIGLALSAAALYLLPLQDWLHFKLISGDEAKLILWLLSAQVLISLLNGVNHAGFRAAGEYALHVGLTNTVRLLQFVSVWLIALAGGKLLAASILFCAVWVMASPALAVLLVRRHRWLSFGMKYASWSELRRLFKPAMANIAFPASQALNVQGMILVVGAVLGPVAVVIFSTLRTLTRLVFQLVVAVGNATEPELAAAYGMRNHRLISALFINQLRAAFWLAAIASVALAASGNLILRLWTHGQIFMQPTLFSFLLISGLASTLWFGSLNALKAANLHLRATVAYVLSSGAAVGLAALMLSFMSDVACAGLALLVMDAAMIFYTARSMSSLLGIRPVSAFLSAVNPYPLCSYLAGKLLTRRA